MILACDQYEQTIRLAWGEDPESVEVEEYEVQEEALRRVQELAAEAEKIVISQESSFAGEPQKEERAVSRIRRLEAVYCGLRGQVNGDRCLILSIGQDSCFGGVVQDGCLIDQRLGSSNLTLRYIASQLGEKNSQLMQALKGYYEGNASDVQAILLQELSKSLRGKAEPSFFFHSLSFPQLVKLLSIPLKEQIQELLIQLDPQRNIKTLICTDWAAPGALAELLQDDYHVVCSPNDPLTDAVRGLVLFGWAEAKKASTARAATFVVRVREKLDAVRRRYPLIEVAAEIRRALLPLLSPTDFKSLSEEEVPYIEYAEGWDALLRGMDQLGQQGSTDLEEQAQRLLREAEGFAERAAHLTRDHRTVRLLPFLERAAQLPAADEQFERLKDLLGVEHIPVKVETEIEVKDLGEFYVTRTKGTGKRIIVEEVIERGYREKATGAVIRRPKVAVRLEEGQEEETKPASQFGQETPQVLLGPADHREEEKEPVAEPFLKVNEGVNREERRKGEKKRRVLVPLLSLGTVVSLLVGLLLFPVRHPELPQPTNRWC